MNIGFIGLGIMGWHMAGHLAQAGHAMRVYTATQGKAERWCDAFGGTPCDSPGSVADNVDVLISIVRDDKDLRSIYLEDSQLFHVLPQGALLIDHTTASQQAMLDIHEAAKAKGLFFADVPVSGGEGGAKKGALSCMAGCDGAIEAKVREITAPYAKQFTRIGDVGSGQVAKSINQICIVGIVQSLAEGIRLGLASGLDMDKVLEVTTQGAAQSWQMENRSRTMIEQDFTPGFTCELMKKDLGIALDLAKPLAVALPQTESIHQKLAHLCETGQGSLDNTALLTLLNH